MFVSNMFNCNNYYSLWTIQYFKTSFVYIYFIGYYLCVVLFFVSRNLYNIPRNLQLSCERQIRENYETHVSRHRDCCGTYLHGVLNKSMGYFKCM